MQMTEAQLYWVRQGLDVVVLQEIRVSRMCQGTVQAALRKAGLKAWFSTPTVGGGGRVTGGVAILSRWPAARIECPKGLDPRRHVCLGVHRAGQRPLQILGAYWDSGDAAARLRHGSALQEWLGATREDVVVLGDFNANLRLYFIHK